MPRAFEDFTPGETLRYGDLTIGRDDIVSFARAFDPQPFHVDEEAAKATFVGALIASGWQTCALHMRMLADNLLNDATSMGAPGIEELVWLKPVRPGDRLRAEAAVLEARPSRSKPDRGLVRFAFTVLNQADEPVMRQTNWILFTRRDPRTGDPPLPVSRGEGRSPLAGAEASPKGEGEGLGVRPHAPHPRAADASLASHPGKGVLSPLPAGGEREAADGSRMPFFEDVEIGAAAQLGTRRFTAEEIVAFARAYDPQPFHIDEAAAQQSHFGGLVASGWHTGSGWMRVMVDHRTRLAEAALAAGRPAPRLGPSPGFKNLQWPKPVRPGDVITYHSTLTDKRASASRPGWGLVFHHNTGVNQHGEEVFAFDGCVFWERRPG